jgi:hypothetical protein
MNVLLSNSGTNQCRGRFISPLVSQDSVYRRVHARQRMRGSLKEYHNYLVNTLRYNEIPVWLFNDTPTLS